MICTLAAAPVVTRTPTQTPLSPASAILLPRGAVVQGPLLRVGPPRPRLGAPARVRVEASLVPRSLRLVAGLEGAEPEGFEPAGQSPGARPHPSRTEVPVEGGHDRLLLFFGDPRRQLVAHGHLQRDVAVLPRRYLLPLCVKHPQGLDQPGAGVGGFDHVIDEPSLRSDIRVAELSLVLGDELSQ